MLIRVCVLPEVLEIGEIEHFHTWSSNSSATAESVSWLPLMGGVAGAGAAGAGAAGVGAGGAGAAGAGAAGAGAAEAVRSCPDQSRQSDSKVSLPRLRFACQAPSSDHLWPQPPW